MIYHSKDGTLYMVQIDHLTGEQLGYAVSRFYDTGASNVQIVSSLTKKNRPSFIVFIDCRQQYCDAVEMLIAEELGVGGWHKIITEHHYLHSRIVERKIRTITDSDVLLTGGPNASAEILTVKGKLFENGNLRPEHDSVVELQEYTAQRTGIHVRYSDVYRFISDCLQNDSDEIIDWKI